MRSILIQHISKVSAFILLLALLSSLLCVPAYAADELRIENNVDIGLVNISLSTTDNDTGTTAAYSRAVMPGETVPRTCQVHNLAEPVWIRVKADIDLGNAVTASTPEDILTWAPGWIQRGGYWYWTKEVASGADVTVYTAVNVPGDLTSQDSGATFRVQMNAEAVQTKNFTPDFSREDPWFGTVIEQAIYESGDAARSESSQAFSVRYEGGAQGLVSVGDDFFSNWGTMMPGDTVSDSVTVSSAYNGTVKIYFRVEAPADNVMPAVNEKITLTIYDGTSVVWTGTLAQGFTDPVEIASLTQGQSKVLTYQVSVPAELGNEFALAKGETIWIFTAEVQRGETGKGGVKTGDDTQPIYVLGAIVLCLGIFGGCAAALKSLDQKSDEDTAEAKASEDEAEKLADASNEGGDDIHE